MVYDDAGRVTVADWSGAVWTRPDKSLPRADRIVAYLACDSAAMLNYGTHPCTGAFTAATAPLYNPLTNNLNVVVTNRLTFAVGNGCKWQPSASMGNVFNGQHELTVLIKTTGVNGGQGFFMYGAAPYTNFTVGFLNVALQIVNFGVPGQRVMSYIADYLNEIYAPPNVPVWSWTYNGSTNSPVIDARTNGVAVELVHNEVSMDSAMSFGDFDYLSVGSNPNDLSPTYYGDMYYFVVFDVVLTTDEIIAAQVALEKE